MILPVTTAASVLGRPIAYPGDGIVGFEQNLRQFAPYWMACDMRLMAERFQSERMIPSAGDVNRRAALLGRPSRTYREFAAEIVT